MKNIIKTNTSERNDFNDALASAISGLILLAPVLFMMGVMVYLAGQLSAVLTGNGWPDVKGEDVPVIVAYMLRHPGEVTAAWPEAVRPQLGPAWLIVTLSTIFNLPLLAFVALIVRYVINFRRRRVWRGWRLGFASRSEINRYLSARAVLKKAGQVRPSLRGKIGVKPQEAGFYLGRDARSRKKLWASIEDGIVIIGAPRSGKDVHYCTANVIDAPGPVIVTSSRSDIFTTTYEARSKVGNVYVFDPQNWTRWPEILRFSPVLGCDDLNDAKKRADYLMDTTGLEVGDGSQVRVITEANVTLRLMLHAAALADKTIRDIARWAKDPEDREPIEILRRYEATGAAGAGTADELEKTASSKRAAEKVYYFVSRAMNMFVATPVMDACDVKASEALLMQNFVKGRNTIYLLDREGDNHLGRLVALMLGDLVGRARTLALRSPNHRLDPPLTLELNDVVSVADLPAIPAMMVDLPALSIAMHVYLQDLSVARHVWDGSGANTLWSNAAVRIVLGGGGHSDDLSELSKLMGQTDDRDGTDVRAIMSPEEIRTMRFGRAVVLARSARPVEVRMTPWWKRADGRAIKDGKKRTEAQIKRNIDIFDADWQGRLRRAVALGAGGPGPMDVTADSVGSTLDDGVEAALPVWPQQQADTVVTPSLPPQFAPQNGIRPNGRRPSPRPVRNSDPR